MGAPTSLVNLFVAAPASSGGGITTIFTHSTSLKNPDGSSGYGGVLDRFVISNNDSAAHTIKVYRVPSSSSFSQQNLIESIQLAGASTSTSTLGSTITTYIFEGPLYSKSSDLYQFQMVEAASSSVCWIQAYYHEMS